MDAQMTKGVVELCILHMISKEKRYGYEIMKHINQVFPHMKESTIYAVLKRLYKEGNGKSRLVCHVQSRGRFGDCG